MKMKKILFLILLVVAIGGWAQLVIVRWPLYQAFSHWWITGERVTVTLEWTAFIPGVAMIAFAILGLRLLKRWDERRPRSPSPPKMSFGPRLVH